MSVTKTELCVGLGIAALLVISVISAYLEAKVQADVWTRQGVPMTAWEVFLGAKPITRNVILEDRSQ